MLPFFTFYGGKNRAAKHYPPPEYDLIVEPFAGSAGYAMNYPDKRVLLIDLDPAIVGTWDYLIHVSAAEIEALPDIAPGQTVDDLSLPQEAKWLIGWWLNKGSAQPKRRLSTFAANYPQGGPYWGPRVKERIVRQLGGIRHWQVALGGYETAPDATATWFVDPPYSKAGCYYKYGSKGISYGDLADWCRARSGQVLVCEADDAAWLPFRPLTLIDSMEGKQIVSRSRVEVLWTPNAGRLEQQKLF